MRLYFIFLFSLFLFFPFDTTKAFYVDTVRFCHGSGTCTSSNATTTASTSIALILDSTRLKPLYAPTSSLSIGLTFPLKRVIPESSIDTFSINDDVCFGYITAGAFLDSSPTHQVNISNIFFNGSYDAPTPPAPSTNTCNSTGVYYMQYHNGLNTSSPLTPHYLALFYDATNQTIKPLSFLQLQPLLPPLQSNLSHNTRFLTFTATTTTPSLLTLNTQYFIDSAEIDTNNSAFYPQYIKVTVANATSSQIITSVSNLTTLTNGSQTTPITLASSLPDGTYELLFTFSNTLYTIGNGSPPFPNAQMYGLVTILGGEVTEYAVTALDTTNLGSVITLERGCSLSDLPGCALSIATRLFVPSQDSLLRIVGLVSSSSVPFVANAYMYYSVTQDSLKNATTTPATSTLAYRFKVDEAGIDIELVSVASIVSNLGPAAPIFRAIMLFLLFLGFWAMVLDSIREKLHVSQVATMYRR
jgi:hypothetical protein